MRHYGSRSTTIVTLLAIALASGCGSAKVEQKGVKGVAADVTLSWAANREKDVNTTGGGYRIYHSTTANFSLSSVTPIDLPYAAGTGAPRTYTFSKLSPGTHYFKIVAYSALGGGSTSEATQVTYTIP